MAQLDYHNQFSGGGGAAVPAGQRAKFNPWNTLPEYEPNIAGQSSSTAQKSAQGAPFRPVQSGNTQPGMGGTGSPGNFGGQPPSGGYQPMQMPSMMPQMQQSYMPQQQQQGGPASPHLTTSIQRRGVMDHAPLLAGANQQAQQFAANNGGAGNQLLADNLQSQMLNRGVAFDRTAGAANARHLLGTQTAAAGDIGAKGGIAQDQLAQQERNNAFQRNLMLQLLGMV